MIRYTVRCAFTDPSVADAWVEWLRDPHLADVCAGGATTATVVRLDGDPVTIEVHYDFPDRAAFAHYQHEVGPRLRDEGLAKFPLELGLTYSRSVGEIVRVHP